MSTSASTFDHPRLGALVKDERLDVWNGRFEFGDQPIYLSIDTVESAFIEEVDEFIATFPAIEAELRRSIAEAIDRDAERLIGMENRYDVEGILEDMKLESVAWSKDGYQVVYDDGGILGHHMMIGNFDHSGRLMEVDFAG